jgi:peptidoglycan/LPS O-acetylase OafA/YrhL
MQALNARPNQLPSLTGLRFVAAFMVLICHLSIFLIPRLDPNGYAFLPLFYAAGTTGVSFFFILSGFVLTWVSKPGDTVPLFWRRRLVKIFPNHVVTLGAAVLLMLAAGFSVTPRNTLPALFLIQGWIPDQNILLNYNSNSPAWSLSCELLFYLAFPWLLKLVRRIRPSRLWVWLGLVVVAVAAAPLAAHLLPASEPMGGTDEPWLQVWFANYFPPVRALEFVLGILIAQIVLQRRWIRLRLLPAVLLAVVSYVASGYLPITFGQVAVTAIPLAFVIAAAATSDVLQRRTVFGGRMVRLGEISYALYLVHWLIVRYGPVSGADTAWGTPIAPTDALISAGVTIVASLVAAWLLYVLIENPAMRHWSRPSRAKTPTTETPSSAPQLTERQ